jgi:hypothetical protein
VAFRETVCPKKNVVSQGRRVGGAIILLVKRVFSCENGF